MLAQKELKMGKNPRTVLRGLNSQIKNEVGIHWLRISINQQYLRKVRAFLDLYFGESVQDGYGLYSYTDRYRWPNKASLNYDSDSSRCERWHGSKFSLDIPGQALDRISHTELHLFLLSLRQFSPTCTRIDVFFDDYNRTIAPVDMREIVDKHDFTGFFRGKVHYENEARLNKGLVHDEIDFGSRGKNGSGKYLRIYDKNLESKGEKNCIRYECEFSKVRAHKVFSKLSQAMSIDAFATLCGSLVAGSIKFVHRNGEKNICRLKMYDFWQEILDLLGSVVIRIPLKKTDIEGKYRFIYHQVTPTLALLRGTFVDDIDFFNWLNDSISDGELRMSQAQINLSKTNKRSIRYDDGKVFDNDGVLISER